MGKKVICFLRWSSVYWRVCDLTGRELDWV